jgi:hypothetical protein
VEGGSACGLPPAAPNDFSTGIVSNHAFAAVPGARRYQQSSYLRQGFH